MMGLGHQCFSVSTFEDLTFFCEKIKSSLEPETIYFLNGDIGSGKTTFMSTLGKLLKTKELVNSPSFNIINEYTFSEGIIYHIDLFRFQGDKNANVESLLMDILESNDKNKIFFIEWANAVSVNWNLLLNKFSLKALSFIWNLTNQNTKNITRNISIYDGYVARLSCPRAARRVVPLAYDSRPSQPSSAQSVSPARPRKPLWPLLSTPGAA